jgi:RHH-type rel operon transcriptional repressor/antitoxin RelB
MPVSVRMQPLLEKELELAARRQGVTKSQFIISAVERALGRKDPGALYHKVREEAARYSIGEGVPEDDLPAHKSPVRRSLRARHQRQQDEYAAWLARRKTASDDDPS